MLLLWAPCCGGGVLRGGRPLFSEPTASAAARTTPGRDGHLTGSSRGFVRRRMEGADFLVQRKALGDRGAGDWQGVGQQWPTPCTLTHLSWPAHLRWTVVTRRSVHVDRTGGQLTSLVSAGVRLAAPRPRGAGCAVTALTAAVPAATASL
ncbi:hypothetical protein ACOMHN_036693 [Nucella lapillus]